MEVILLDKVTNLGNMGDKVRVKPGYARNYLLPKGMAQPATKENLVRFEAQRAALEQLAAEKLEKAQARAAQYASASVTLVSRAGDEGKLFGSIGAREVADALTSAGLPTEKSEVRLQNGPLRETGEFAVGLHLHSDVDVEVTVVVEAQPA